MMAAMEGVFALLAILTFFGGLAAAIFGFILWFLTWNPTCLWIGSIGAGLFIFDLICLLLAPD